MHVQSKFWRIARPRIDNTPFVPCINFVIPRKAVVSRGRGWGWGGKANKQTKRKKNNGKRRLKVDILKLDKKSGRSNTELVQQLSLKRMAVHV